MDIVTLAFAKKYADQLAFDPSEISDAKITEAINKIKGGVSVDFDTLKKVEDWLKNKSIYGDGNEEIPVLIEDEVAKIKSEGERQLGAVNDAGAAQVKSVIDEGVKQKKIIDDAANGIVADRKQIAKNQKDILLKLDINQGVENKGKFLTVGDDGNINLISITNGNEVMY